MTAKKESAEIASPQEQEKTKPSLAWIAWQFLKIGAMGFGGGVAVIALIQRECVERKKCVEAEEFLHGVGLGQILGSFAVNTAFFVGHRMRGLLGALTAMIAFLAPSVTLVIGLSWLYFTTQKIPSLQNALNGAGPVVIAIITSAAISLGKKTLKSLPAWFLGGVGVLGTLFHVSLITLILCAACVGYVLKMAKENSLTAGKHTNSRQGSEKALMGATTITAAKVATGTTSPILVGTTAATFSLFALALLFLKVGFMFFGGGYVLVPLLQHELVSKLHLLTEREFLDGVAISQLTPGPIAVLATYVGYRFGGALGAVLATACLYAPATTLMAFISHVYTRIRHLDKVRDALAGISAVIVGMILASAVELAPHSSISLKHPFGIVLAATSLYFLERHKWHPAILLAAGALLGTFLPGVFAG